MLELISLLSYTSPYIGYVRYARYIRYAPYFYIAYKIKGGVDTAWGIAKFVKKVAGWGLGNIYSPKN